MSWFHMKHRTLRCQLRPIVCRAVEGAGQAAWIALLIRRAPPDSACSESLRAVGHSRVRWPPRHGSSSPRPATSVTVRPTVTATPNPVALADRALWRIGSAGGSDAPEDRAHPKERARSKNGRTGRTGALEERARSKNGRTGRTGAPEERACWRIERTGMSSGSAACCGRGEICMSYGRSRSPLRAVPAFGGGSWFHMKHGCRGYAAQRRRGSIVPYSPTSMDGRAVRYPSVPRTHRRWRCGASRWVVWRRVVWRPSAPGRPGGGSARMLVRSQRQSVSRETCLFAPPSPPRERQQDLRPHPHPGSRLWMPDC